MSVAGTNLTLTAVAVCAISLSAFGEKHQADSSIVLKTSSDSISYLIGYDFGRSLKPLKDEISYSVLLRGIQDNLRERKPAMADSQMQRIGMALNERMQTEQDKLNQEQGEKNKQREREFLAKNATVKGVVTTSSGLQYSVIKQGTGPKPKPADKVTVNYKGTTLDGKEFDNSYKRGQPASFQLSTVIPGWTEGLQLMPVGSTYRFWIPEKLAYGQSSPDPSIGPSEMLIFDVELIRIDQ